MFQSGDRVRFTGNKHIMLKYGDTGTYLAHDTEWGELVRWDVPKIYMHSCKGLCEDGHGFGVIAEFLELEAPIDFGEFTPNLAQDSISELLGG